MERVSYPVLFGAIGDEIQKGTKNYRKNLVSCQDVGLSMAYKCLKNYTYYICPMLK